MQNVHIGVIDGVLPRGYRYRMKTGFRAMVRVQIALFALAIALLGFGHHHHEAPERDPDLVAYLELGGSLDDLCLTEMTAQADGEAPDGTGGRVLDCPACMLAGAFALPDGAATALIIGYDTLVVPLPLVPGRVALFVPPAPPARGPPLSIV